jgi:hypothetical protein
LFMKNQHLPYRFIAWACLAASSASAWAVIDKPTEPYISYTVKQGDILQNLARDLLSDPRQWPQLARQNGMKDPNRIYPGQVIDVPRSLLNLNTQPKTASGGMLQSISGQVTVNGQAAQVGSAVPEGARVQTASGSSATVKLADGSTVQLMPRSLAEVLSSSGYQLKDPASSISTTWYSGVIRLVEGVLDVAADKRAKRLEPLGVTTPTALVGVRGTQFRVAYEDPASRQARTEVLEGQVRSGLRDSTINADVNGGFGVAVKPGDREIKVAALLPALPDTQLPELVQRSLQAKQAVWTVGVLAGAAGYRAELAQDEAFAQIVSDAKSATPALDFSSAPNGSYYARVRGFDGAGIEGYNAVRRITISDAPAPAPRLIWIREINVAASADFTPEGLRLRVNTSAADTPRNLQMQIAQDAGFTQGVQTLSLGAQSNILIPDLKAGDRRFVRFMGTSPQGQAGSSPTLLLELPADWGSTVFGLNSALQTLP